MIATIVSWVLLIAAVLGGIGMVALITGSLLPRSHVVGRSLSLGQEPQAVWEAVHKTADVPRWHIGVREVERLPDRNGHEVWQERYAGGCSVVWETVVAVAPYQLVRVVANEKGPFTGRWELTVSETETGCRVTLVEYGVIPNPFYRLLALLFVDLAAPVEAYLAALAGRFGEPADIRESVC
jgi:hypothetical protein